MKIPCKVNKCISYPVCVSKREIECDLIFNWIFKEKVDEAQHKRWMYMKRYLIEVFEIKGKVQEEFDNDPNTMHKE